MPLTVKKVEKLIRNGVQGVHPDKGLGAARGLRLIVKSKTNASWLLRYQLDRRQRYMGLGSAADFSLAEARERALEARKKLADKVDPIDAKRAERAAQRLATAKAPPTFKKCAEDYLAANGDEWRSQKHAVQWLSTLENFVFPLIGNLPVNEIDTDLVLRVLEQPVEAVPKRNLPAGTLWKARRSTASRLRGRIELILAWSTVRGFRSGDNPARWRGHIAQVLRKDKALQVAHHQALPYAELPVFMTALRAREGVAARALEFSILCASRTGEVTGAKWSEIDFDEKLWVIPAERMKAAAEHRVPLSSPAIALLKALYTEDGNAHVFVGKKEGAGLAATALADTMKRMKYDGTTVHGFRSTFRDWAAERTNFPREICELALAHTVGSEVETAYRRSDLLAKRRRLMEQWSKYCYSPPVRQKAGSNNIVSFGVR